MTNTPRRSRRGFWTGSMLIGAAVATASWLAAADHIDGPLISNDASGDIADVYAFVSPNDPNRVVLAMTLHGFVAPAENGVSLFDPNVLYQFKIDNNGDAVEDLVIQAFVTGRGANQAVHFRGPVTPDVVGASARIVKGAETATVRVSTDETPIVASRNDMTVFGGVRDDPFFFDFGQFSAILGGQAGGFNDPGADSFAGFNAYALVVELPASALGGSPNFSVWATTSR